VDDIEVPELGFLDKADSDSGWTGQGFSRTSGSLPQRFLIQVIQEGQPSEPMNFARIQA